MSSRQCCQSVTTYHCSTDTSICIINIQGRPAAEDVKIAAGIDGRVDDSTTIRDTNQAIRIDGHAACRPAAGDRKKTIGIDGRIGCRPATRDIQIQPRIQGHGIGQPIGDFKSLPIGSAPNIGVWCDNQKKCRSCHRLYPSRGSSAGDFKLTAGIDNHIGCRPAAIDIQIQPRIQGHGIGQPIGNLESLPIGSALDVCVWCGIQNQAGSCLRHYPRRRPAAGHVKPPAGIDGCGNRRHATGNIKPPAGVDGREVRRHATGNIKLSAGIDGREVRRTVTEYVKPPTRIDGRGVRRPPAGHVKIAPGVDNRGVRRPPAGNIKPPAGVDGRGIRRSPAGDLEITTVDGRGSCRSPAGDVKPSAGIDGRGVRRPPAGDRKIQSRIQGHGIGQAIGNLKCLPIGSALNIGVWCNIQKQLGTQLRRHPGRRSPAGDVKPSAGVDGREVRRHATGNIKPPAVDGRGIRRATAGDLEITTVDGRGSRRSPAGDVKPSAGIDGREVRRSVTGYVKPPAGVDGREVRRHATGNIKPPAVDGRGIRRATAGDLEITTVDGRGSRRSPAGDVKPSAGIDGRVNDSATTRDTNQAFGIDGRVGYRPPAGNRKIQPRIQGHGIGQAIGNLKCLSIGSALDIGVWCGIQNQAGSCLRHYPGRRPTAGHVKPSTGIDGG